MGVPRSGDRGIGAFLDPAETDRGISYRRIGEKVSIFHLLALLLVVGLSLDYSIFFNRMFDQSSSGLRTLKALVLCATTTIVVFGILAYSSVPILHGIGLTVSIGVGFGLLCVFILGSRKCNDET